MKARIWHNLVGYCSLSKFEENVLHKLRTQNFNVNGVLRMIKKGFAYIGIFCFSIIVLGLLYIFVTPYKLKRTLPKISVSQVEKVIAKVDKNPDKDLLEGKDIDLERIVKCFNESKELKHNIGTTPDTTIEIHLKDKNKIRIFTWYSKEQVTIDYLKNDGYHYLTQVRSKELATFVEDIRKKAGLQSVK
jgi:hypothetical protein